jgi:hypothetical protein
MIAAVLEVIRMDIVLLIWVDLCCVFRRIWTLVPPQTGQLFQRKLDAHSAPNWTLRT